MLMTTKFRTWLVPWLLIWGTTLQLAVAAALPAQVHRSAWLLLAVAGRQSPLPAADGSPVAACSVGPAALGGRQLLSVFGSFPDATALSQSSYSFRLGDCLARLSTICNPAAVFEVKG